MLASCWHIYTSRRQAEAFRWLWTGTGVEGVSDKDTPPVWVVGMGGLLEKFQEAQGTGFFMVNWGCKVSHIIPLWLEAAHTTNFSRDIVENTVLWVVLQSTASHQNTS